MHLSDHSLSQLDEAYLQSLDEGRLKQLPDSHPAYPLIKDLVTKLIVNFPRGRAYDPEDDGWIALIKEPDVDRVISEIWSDWTLAEVEWEGITYRDGFWQAIYLVDNEKGLAILIFWSNAPCSHIIPISVNILLYCQLTAGGSDRTSLSV